ncbi:type VII secretion protein EccCa [Actinoplanes sp. CA-030573]|uniref:type VII secretion protein EccCa n=1 Tax=Actinoplanes sp. CA-030573 TaxID=3239898 RepID=UPI003D8B2AC4
MILPKPPSGDIQLQPPPTLPRTSANAGTQLMVVLPMMLMMGVMGFVYIGRVSGPMVVIFGGLYAGVMIVMVVFTLGRSGSGRKRQINDERKDYLRYLGSVRRQVRRNALHQRAALLLAHPDPDSLAAIAVSDRLWERRPGDPDFVQLRIGTGPQLLSTELRPPQTAPLEDLDPMTATSLRHFIRTYVTVPALPVALSMRGTARVTLVGARSVTLATARTLICQLVTFHTAEDVRVALCVAPHRRGDWDWLKWLPHLRHAQHAGALGPRLLVADQMSTLETLLSEEIAGRGPFAATSARPSLPHILVVVDGGQINDAVLDRDQGFDGVTILALDAQMAARPGELRFVVEAERMGSEGLDGIRYLGRPDLTSDAAAIALARNLAVLPGPGRGPTEDSLTQNLGLPDLLSMGDPRAMTEENLRQLRSRRYRLRIPIGLDQRGTPVELDLKEAAEGGMGPHGLVIGATGSGKSELLRTLVAGLAVTHSSEILNFVLVDFKGGATFVGLDQLPHTSATITNLADDLTLVDRMRDALNGELIRRQELLRRVGGYASVRDYERARAAGTPLEPLPSLLVIIDEFSELLTNQPEFIDLFVTIGRLGRSLGVHLLLASQRLEEGRLRGLESHLSYRIGLKTFSAAESRSVLGVPDAYQLPPVPGSGFLRHDTSSLVRFKAAYVSGALPRRSTGGQTKPSTPEQQVRLFDLDRASRPLPETPKAVAATPAPTSDHVEFADTVLGAIISGLRDGPAAHRVWLPPLATPPALNRILPPLANEAGHGLTPAGWPGRGRLAIPLGVIDMPFEQRRDLLWADLSGAAGNAIVVGAPRTGKSTIVRTVLTALALTHTPLEVQIYCVDLGGGTLAPLADLPHVGAVAAARDAERCSRLIAELSGLLARREAEFARLQLDSIAAARHARDPDGRRLFADVFLVIDGWLNFRELYEHLEDQVVTLARRGLGYGIHVVLTANRWFDVRSAVRDLIGTRLELRLGDPSDSEVDRRAAVTVPEGRPGRGITRSKHHFLAALPRIDDRTSTDDLATGVQQLVARVAGAWDGPVAPRVRLLPTTLDLAALDAPRQGRLDVPIGVAEVDLGTAYVEFGSESHLMIFGDAESGKTTVLHTLATGTVRHYTPEQVRLVIADYRRGLLGAFDGPHLLGHAGGEAALTSMVAEVVQAMRNRLPGPDVTPEQLKARSWWRGPELFLVVDDYDLVAATATNPLLPLVELLPHARDIGLHLIVARRSGGAGRALYDPLLAQLRELSAPGLLLSTNAEEGQLFGVRATPLPAGRGTLVTRRRGAQLIHVASDARANDS